MSKPSSASKIKMTSYEDLFEIKEDTTKVEDNCERIQQIPLADLHTFKDHPFKVLDDDKMEETKESIAKYGVLVPIIARPRTEGGYEVIAGHRRKYASELLELAEIPALIRDLDDDESVIIMVDSNIQRENLLYSEKAYAYKMKLDAVKNQGARSDLTLEQVVPKLTAREQVAKDAGEKSGMQISRYIRLTELIPSLLDMVDDKKLAFNTAVELSYLSHKEQQKLLDKIEEFQSIPSMAQATKLKKYSSEGKLTQTLIDSILLETMNKPIQVTLKKDKLNKYFPKHYSSAEMEKTIIALLEDWHKKQ